MFKHLLLLLIAFTMISCAHSVNRIGYTKNTATVRDCPAVIQKFATISDSVALKVGSIKLGESGFSVSCSEENALAVLKREACSLDADLINITEETRPDFKSTCYRCKADFYKLQRGTSLPAASLEYTSENVRARATNDKKTNRAMIWGGLLGGVIGAFVANALFMK